ncbi:MAG: ATP-binding protein [Roseibacillus sp.]
MKIKRREKDAVLQSLQAGLVPRQGLHLIQVGRQLETNALLTDIERIREGGAAFRIVVGRFGSGKSFFINLVRTVVLQQDLVVAQADFSMDRRLYASGGEARALYSELTRNLATRSRPDGDALPSICEKWISEVRHDVLSKGGKEEDVEGRLMEDIGEFQNLVGGFEFAEVLRLYYLAWQEGDDTKKACCLRWLRAEYTTKTEARQDLGVRRIIDDDTIYESLKLLALFSKKAGYQGLFVALDELVVLTHRLPSTRSRTANFEAILTLLNDCIQGRAEHLGFLLAGTDDSLTDKRRGLYSYEALRSRLAENQFAADGLVDLSGPVIRLQALTPEDLFVLLRNISIVHAGGDSTKVTIPEDGIFAVLKQANETLGAEFFKTPRDIIRSFVGLLNILDQNRDRTWQDLLSVESSKVFTKPSGCSSVEEEIENETATEDPSDDLADFKL